MNADLYRLCNTYGIRVRTTSDFSPAHIGICEGQHSLADSIISTMLRDDPQRNLQVCADLACLARNAEIGQLGYSSLQIANGQNPLVPLVTGDFTQKVATAGI